MFTNKYVRCKHNFVNIVQHNHFQFLKTLMLINRAILHTLVDVRLNVAIFHLLRKNFVVYCGSTQFDELLLAIECRIKSTPSYCLFKFVNQPLFFTGKFIS